MKKEDVLKIAETLITGQRADDYGSVYDNFSNIAEMWSILLKTPVSCSDVALCMATVKMCRLIKTPGHEDSWVDLAGYAAIGGELASCEH